MDKAQYKTVPVEPTPEMMQAADDRVGMHQHEESRAAYAAMLAAAPQPPSASGEREAFEAWAKSEWPNSAAPDNAWIGWQARAALAPSPGIDAAWQKPVAWMLEFNMHLSHGDAFPGVTANPLEAEKWQHEGYDLTPLYAAPPAAQPSAQECKEAVDAELVSIESRADSFATPREAVCALIDWHAEAVPRSAARQSAAWLAEAERLVDFYAESFSKSTDSGKCRQRLAALLDHLKVRT